MKADEEDDAPTIAAVIDERPEELRTVNMEFYRELSV